MKYKILDRTIIIEFPYIKKEERMKRVILVLIFVFIVSLSFAYDTESHRKSLMGLEGFAIEIQIDSKEEMLPDGLTPEQIKTDVELKLMLGGIKIIDETRAKDPKFWTNENYNKYAILSVTLFLLHSKDKTFFVHSEKLEVLQNVVLDRNKGIFVSIVPTWSVELTGFAGNKVVKGAIKDSIKDLMDAFLYAFLSVNPKSNT